MNWKVVTTLGVLAIGMLFYLQFGVIRKAEQKEEIQKIEARAFPDLKNIEKIVILNSRDPEIVLSQKDHLWNIEHPIKDIVSSSQLESLLGGLGGLQIKTVLLEGEEYRAREAELSQYGFKDKSFQVELQFNSTKHKVIFGDLVGDSFDLYARIENDPRVLIVGSELEGVRTQGAEDWREKRLANINPSDILKLNIQRKADELEFAREASDKPWRMLKPQDLPIDQEFTNNRITNIKLIQASRFLNEMPKALNQPSVRIKATFADGVRDARSKLDDPLPQGIEIILAKEKLAGEKNKDAADDFDYFGKSDKTPPALIARFHYENFDRPVADFIDRKFDEFLSAEVLGLKVWSKGNLTTEVKRTGETAEIKSVGESKWKPANEQSFEKAVHHLRNIVATEYRSLERKPEPKRGEWAVELTFKDPKASRYFIVESPTKEGFLWANKFSVTGSEYQLKYRLRANAIDPKLFEAKTLMAPPQDVVEPKPAPSDADGHHH